MNCPSCGFSVADGATFCDNCGASTSLTPHSTQGTNMRSVLNRIDLQTHPDLLVSLGAAEDGIPLVFSITRSREVGDLQRALATSLGPSHPLITSIESSLREYWVQQGVYQLSLPGNVTLPCYISRRNLSEVLGTSLLATLILPLPSVSLPSFPSAKAAGSKAVATATHRLAVAQHKVIGRSTSEIEWLSSTGGQNRFLALSTRDQRIFVIGWKDESKRDVPAFQREFVTESLSAFSDCTFQIRVAAYGNPISAPFVGNIKAFPMVIGKLLDMARKGSDLASTASMETEHLKRILDDLFNKGDATEALGTELERLSREVEDIGKDKSKDLLRVEDVKFNIPYTSIVKIIAQIAHNLDEEYHRSGKVHGDLKPQNILLSSSGPRLIDDLNMKVGDISPAMSPGWGAPEQVSIQQTVQCATDIYPIGVILVSLLKGQVTGEMVHHAIPSSQGTPRVVSFIRDPMVYLDPSTEIVPKDGMRDWLNFVERCLHFNPTLRFANGGECARELETLLTKYPLQGKIEFSLQNRGEIERAHFSDDSEGLCHVVSDQPYS